MDHQLWHIADRLPPGLTRIRCPYCSDERRRTNQNTKTLSITIEDRFALYNCHHCNEHGRFSLDRDRQEQIRYKRQEKPLPPASSRILNQPHIAYLASRGISLETANKAGVYSIDVYMREHGDLNALAFTYPTATKFRATHIKGFSSHGAACHYYLQNLVVDGSPLVITEGEMDALSMLEAGIPNAVSVPNGAPQSISEGRVSPKEDGKFKYVWNAQDAYKACKRVVIATDNDEPGQALSEELARRIGKYRCFRVKFPDGLKDANEVLVKLGPEALRDLVEAAEPWPVAGLYDTDHYASRVFDLYLRGQAKGASTGFKVLDKYYTIAPGQFTVVTGIPSSGKSEFIDHLMVELAARDGWRFAVCSFENPPDAHIVKLIEKRARLPFYKEDETGDKNGGSRASEADIRSTLNWVSDHFYWIEQADGASSSIDDIIERAKVAVMRYGVRGVVIDPYNFIDKPGNMPETEFVSESLTKIKQFAVGHDVHVWFIAHPTKLKRDESGTYPPPGGYEISGSAAWFAKADCGLTVHRGSTPFETEIHLWKIRFKWIGKPGMMMLAYDKTTGRYSDGRESGDWNLPELLYQDDRFTIEEEKAAPYYTH